MNELWKQLRTFNWATAEPLHALLCLPGVALPLLIGVMLGYHGTAVLMAGGAQTVGFGSFQQPLYRRSGPMIAASVGIAISALVGALCRDSTPALLAAVAVWCVVYGFGTSISSATGWVGQQCCVFLIVSSAAASTPGTTHDLVKSALLRGAGVLAGGALQTGLILLFRQWWPEAQTRFSNALQVYESFGKKGTLVPHAPYSVSEKLWLLLASFYKDKTVSIHNQETSFEDELFINSFRLYLCHSICILYAFTTGASNACTYFTDCIAQNNPKHSIFSRFTVV